MEEDDDLVDPLMEPGDENEDLDDGLVAPVVDNLDLEVQDELMSTILTKTSTTILKRKSKASTTCRMTNTARTLRRNSDTSPTLRKPLLEKPKRHPKKQKTMKRSRPRKSGSCRVKRLGVVLRPGVVGKKMAYGARCPVYVSRCWPLPNTVSIECLSAVCLINGCLINGLPD